MKRGEEVAKKDEKKVLKKFCEKAKVTYLCCPAGKLIERLAEEAERVETKGFCLEKFANSSELKIRMKTSLGSKFAD